LGLELDWIKFLNGFGIRIGWAKDWGTFKKNKIIGVNLKNKKSPVQPMNSSAPGNNYYQSSVW
jgi:hypothetical protein